MPFTPSHAVVALPFVRSPLPFGAVAVGSMAPDLPLFFPVGVTYETTHGVSGLLVVSVPLGALLYLVWLRVLRPGAGVLLPQVVGTRLPRAWTVPGAVSPGRLLRVLVAVVIGVLTHVGWDAFTHPGRLGSTLLPALAEPWGPFVGTQWAQYGSSVVGLAVLAVAAARYLRRVPVSARPRASRTRTVSWWLAAAALVTGPVAVAVTRGLPSDVGTAKSFAFFAGTASGALLLLLAVGASVAVQLGRRVGGRVAGRVDGGTTPKEPFDGRDDGAAA
ncbi:DUF4184 family protein [Frigoribacterium endophyticum]|uniref:DUF4184 family protein n=1 Tax=Frigoribacterium endophyticum TaxID=1522176 RepID=UPI001423F557|nr:hypothetical protein [Frigoribacterium endophyticum]